MVAKGGARLLDDDAIETLKRELLPLALVVTPNRPEAEALTGHRVDTWEDAKQAARELVAMGARSAVIKGGHFEGANATDLFYDGSFRDYTAVRIDSNSTHGTGCTFAAAIAAGLAKGVQLTDAVAQAKSYVTLAIQHAYPIGHGTGPVHHFYRYWQPSGQKYRPGIGVK